MDLCRRDYPAKELPQNTAAQDSELVGQVHPNAAAWDANTTYAVDYTGSSQAPGPTYATQTARVVATGATCSGRAGLQGADTQYHSDYVPKASQVLI